MKSKKPKPLIDGKYNPLYGKWYRENNKEAIDESNKKYNQSDKSKETRRIYRENNLGMIAESNRKYRSSEKGKKTRELYLKSDAGLAMSNKIRKKSAINGKYADRVLWGMSNKEICG